MISVIYTTLDNEQDARKIANFLIEEQIVACVNIIPNVISIYRWKGKIEEEKEFILIAKTVDENVIKTIKRIKELHNYELPDIIAIPVNNGYDEYLEYIKRETE
ncbi:MAG: divalent-cation tolerance protein CutA [Candidatus Thermoplasmatota archaeon]|nr:divalent-cation tolerance protein CutA [Candidatus Thermoplasmatota archaeon]MCK5300829.1 divalent-cation tolerance protein CutA [Thermoplasmatales archaeon]